MDFVKITREAHHVHLCIDRPSRGNALGLHVVRELSEALKDMTAELAPWIRPPFPKPPPVRALVITANPTGRGPIWVAGGDLKELASLKPKEGADYARRFGRFLRQLDCLPIPVLIAIDGAAIGGGAELALAGDIRIATRRSTLQFKQLHVGLACGFGSTKRLVDLVGHSRAKRLLFLGQTLPADDAATEGLLHEVVIDAAALAERTLEICSLWEQLSPEALWGQKRMFQTVGTVHPGLAAIHESETFASIWGNPTHRAFLDTFTKKKAKEGSGHES